MAQIVYVGKDEPPSPDKPAKPPRRRFHWYWVIGAVLIVGVGLFVFLPHRVFWVDLDKYRDHQMGDPYPEPVEAKAVYSDDGWKDIKFQNRKISAAELTDKTAYHVFAADTHSANFDMWLHGPRQLTHFYGNELTFDLLRFKLDEGWFVGKYDWSDVSELVQCPVGSGDEFVFSVATALAKKKFRNGESGHQSKRDNEHPSPFK